MVIVLLRLSIVRTTVPMVIVLLRLSIGVLLCLWSSCCLGCQLEFCFSASLLTFARAVWWRASLKARVASLREAMAKLGLTHEHVEFRLNVSFADLQVHWTCVFNCFNITLSSVV